jgi:hypothetical protein
MRDVLSLPFNDKEFIVVASDNSGSIGNKPGDSVYTDYETVAYYSVRVAAMECISAGARPFAVMLQNFCGEDAWKELELGVKKGLAELKLPDVKITGSTETNFTLNQSAVGLSVLGKTTSLVSGPLIYTEDLRLAVIGSPLVGGEVLERSGDAAPLSLFAQLHSFGYPVLLPVGSKGILYELNKLFANRTFTKEKLIAELDMLKSSGPATCFIIVFPLEKEEEIKSIAGRYFHPVTERRDSDA